MEIKIIEEKIKREQLKDITKLNMIKGVVDIKKRVIALGGEFHSDSNDVLIKKGSSQEDIWGINLYLEKPKEEWIEYISLINIRPADNNFDMEIQNQEIKDRIRKIVNSLII